ncbi:hypothetical protein [Rhizobium sp. RM]|uniref:GTA-gp10 family protein n=1 Tax=Rhizobium sp. RM TaxID=2748079 RepID=UPI00110E694E|nr:hypothetical protein [Rhizobium sp. RM]NWJ24771.1 hypothetical protein [Rhizobium sp. RM]TMV16570.1 hypothetical protein BJG94_19225 [Rhizobium sp. Td3]
MANPNLGQVHLQAGDEEYRISFGINALCELEDVFGKSVQKIVEEDLNGDDITMKAVRNVVWAGLLDQHPEITVKEAGNVVSKAGMQNCMDAISKAFALAFPEAKGSKNPRRGRG